MSTQAVEQKSTLDTVKWIVAIGFVVAGIVGFNYLAEQAVWIRALVVLASIALAIGLVMTTAKGKNLWLFIKESRTELRKVIWPTRSETVRTTMGVLVMVIILGLFLWGLDSLVVWAFSPIIG